MENSILLSSKIKEKMFPFEKYIINFQSTIKYKTCFSSQKMNITQAFFSAVKKCVLPK